MRGNALGGRPFPATFVSILGFGLIVASYLPVRKLKVESDFRVVIYIFLVSWSLSLLGIGVQLAGSGAPRDVADVNDLYFWGLRGFAAVASLALFYRWVGAKNMITRFW